MRNDKKNCKKPYQEKMCCVSGMMIGSFRKLPHYAVIGNRDSFYLWRNDDGRGSASVWFKGKEALRVCVTLERLFKEDKSKFVEMLIKYHLKSKFYVSDKISNT